MPGRNDSVSNIASRGCVKCCAYCRISPEGSALCYGGLALVVVTVVMYFMSSVLASAASEENLKKSPEPMCSEIAPLSIGNSTAEVYTTYLRVAGGVVVLLIIAVILGCCVCCSLLCGFPRPIKIVGCVCLIPTLVFFSFYLAWSSVGTYLLTVMEPSEYGIDGIAVCRHILMFVILFWFYLLCLCVFGALVTIWKLCSLKKNRKGSGGGVGQLIGNSKGGSSIV